MSAFSISSFVYIQPALIAPPTLPRLFDDNSGDTPPPWDGPPDLALDAECSVSKLLYEIMCYNLESQNQLGKEDDIAARLSFYQKLKDWRAPPRGVKSRGLHGLCQSFLLEFVAHLPHI